MAEIEQQTYLEFLIEKATEVEKLAADNKSKECFYQHIKTLWQKVGEWESEIALLRKNAEAERDLLEYNDGEPPKAGYVWYNNFWGPPTKSYNPLRWFPPCSWSYYDDLMRKQARAYAYRMPNDDEKLMCHYVLLSVIHDKALRDPLIDRLYFNKSCIDFDGWKDNWGKALWKYLNILPFWKGLTSEGEVKASICVALDRVKADLAAAKPTKTERPPKKEGYTKVSTSTAQAGKVVDINLIINAIAERKTELHNLTLGFSWCDDLRKIVVPLAVLDQTIQPLDEILDNKPEFVRRRYDIAKTSIREAEDFVLERINERANLRDISAFQIGRAHV